MAPFGAQADCVSGGTVASSTNGNINWSSGDCTINTNARFPISSSRRRSSPRSSVGTLSNSGTLTGFRFGLLNSGTIASILNNSPGLISGESVSGAGLVRPQRPNVGRQWDREGADIRRGSVPDLREAVAADPKLRVLIVHGWNDLSCPFMGSVLTVGQMPIMGDPTRVAVHEFPGGHMFYTRESSRAELRKDVMEMYAKH